MSSIASQIADATVTAITALGLTYGTPAVAFTVVRRKVPTLPAGVDPPQIVVVIQEEGEVEYMTARRNLVKYPLGVVFFTGKGVSLADDEALRLIRQSVRQKIDDKEKTAFAGVPSFNRITTGGKRPFDPAALPKDLNASALLFTAECLETKAT